VTRLRRFLTAVIGAVGLASSGVAAQPTTCPAGDSGFRRIVNELDRRQQNVGTAIAVSPTASSSIPGRRGSRIGKRIDRSGPTLASGSPASPRRLPGWRSLGYGYNLLAMAIETAAGMPFQRFVETTIFGPLGPHPHPLRRSPSPRAGGRRALLVVRPPFLRRDRTPGSSSRLGLQPQSGRRESDLDGGGSRAVWSSHPRARAGRGGSRSVDRTRGCRRGS
jgi:CubicO group peptidase (beta-lactamase class C family)